MEVILGVCAPLESFSNQANYQCLYLHILTFILIFYLFMYRTFFCYLFIYCLFYLWYFVIIKIKGNIILFALCCLNTILWVFKIVDLICRLETVSIIQFNSSLIYNNVPLPIQSDVHSFIYNRVHSFVHNGVHSFINNGVYSFIHSKLHLYS